MKRIAIFLSLLFLGQMARAEMPNDAEKYQKRRDKIIAIATKMTETISNLNKGNVFSAEKAVHFANMQSTLIAVSKIHVIEHQEIEGIEHEELVKDKKAVMATLDTLVNVLEDYGNQVTDWDDDIEDGDSINWLGILE